LIFETTALPGVFLVGIERLEDERGFFARTWCRDEFWKHGIEVDMVQASVSYSKAAGTLRGLHFSSPPSTEAKLVRCTRGRIHDVVLDLRPASPAFRRHIAVTLDAREHTAIFIPHGLAHGFQTLEDECEVMYMMTDRYRPESAAGYRFDDPAFGIQWPLGVSCISQRDRSYPLFS
jgi:dTDP-4-dehydrorhamnose 3,5-epimerase